MVDDDGIVILDFKTDQVSEKDLEDKMSLYRPQISTYAKALSRIYGKPVKAAYLYFFRLNRTISVI
jgi:ATP-dependent helicase/nuclease subunit A